MLTIEIRGAKTHNLQNIDVSIPRDQLIVITGLSGSGKSSLAFDTLYAEGQRRYVESLSTYARQFLSLMEKPDVDHIEGLSPAISIKQKSTSHNPRSTVGTVTEIHDYLRLLFARVGKPKCPIHHTILEAQTISQMVDQILMLPESTKILLLAPVIQNRKGEHLQYLKSLRNQGFIRARINGKFVELDILPKLALHQKHTIDIIIDRLKIKSDIQSRLADSLETTLNLTKGVACILLIEKDEEIIYSVKFSCSICGYSLTELEPRIFSFNSPSGACLDCDGLGVKQFMDPNKIIVDNMLSLASGAIRGWDRNNFYYYSMLCSLAVHYQLDLEKPFNKLSKKHQKVLLYGSGDEMVIFSYEHDQRIVTREHTFEGIVANMERRYRETKSQYVRDELARYLVQQVCPNCHGARLKKTARYVFIQECTLPCVSDMPIAQAHHFFKNLSLTGWRAKVAKKILKAIIDRLEFLINVGLDYLTLSRSANSLSGGEVQRIRLASQIGGGLVGVLYVLDEPSIGLHQRDNVRLIETLTNLRDLGNTVIVVEHDEEAILQADYVIDIGPGAGIHGGKIIACGTPRQIMSHKDSITGHYLSGKKKIFIPAQRMAINNKLLLQLVGASENNLQDITVNFPIGLFTCVTGVSGSGKSTLVNDTLYPIAARSLNGVRQVNVGSYHSISGLEHLDKVVDISQTPIGRTPRSNAATYTGVFTDIRALFSSTTEAKVRGYKSGRFSFNVKGGRCEACHGDGLIKVEMHFLSDIYVTCDGCEGKRYNRETLEIFYKGKNIYDVLEMTTEEGLVFLHAIPSIKRRLKTLIDVGLGYIKLGQSATTLSGGEAQRIKLAKELSRRDTGKTLYILDEPTTGLHFHDIKRLLGVLIRLREHGNTIIIIEHNLDVIKTADWIIDLGPDGGNGGGKVVAVGTPEIIAQQRKSYTGKFLKSILQKC